MSGSQKPYLRIGRSADRKEVRSCPRRDASARRYAVHPQKGRSEMRRILASLVALTIACMVSAALAGEEGPRGPAPNSGDGISDGSGYENAPPNRPNDNGGEDTEPCGPAPNSGDGVPDGSGFDGACSEQDG